LINSVSWGIVNWNIFSTINNNWFDSLISYWDVILTINVNYMSSIVWSWNCWSGCRDRNILLEQRCEFLRNHVKRNVSNITDFEGINWSFFLWINWSTWTYLFFSSFLNWNVCFSFNDNRLVVRGFDWYEIFTINLYYYFCWSEFLWLEYW